MVSVEHFQEAFRDIGTACIPLEACSWEEAKRAREYINLDADMERDDAMFACVVSCLC